MCILCVVQRWSRRAATMLPWLLIPLVVLWALSQLLPPGLRFEFTSPRLACVLVLVVTLFWYEILMPQLSVWHARRSARLRERRRIQAIEMQKLRRIATRRCRNCHTPYRDQNPGGGGRFMCSYCGHVSKRPVLDIPGPTGGSRIIGNLVGKNGWTCSQDWSPEGTGNWVVRTPQYWVGGGGDDRCSTERSYSGMFVSAYRLFSWFFYSMRWLCRKVFRTGSSSEEGSFDAENKGLSSRKGDNDEDFQESRGEKARRKAEEKRQARLEKEMLEEEERKQREEVAKLVEERRKLRDEKLDAKEGSKSSASGGERGGRKEAEKRSQERRKEKDKGSSKSNSDGEELEKSVIMESKRKHEFDKKTEHGRRDFQNTMVENHKSHASELGHGNKIMTSKTRYFNHMKDTFLSSSGGFDGSSFFGRNIQHQSSVASAIKETKPHIRFIEHRQNHGNVRDVHSTGRVMARSTQNGDHRPTGSNAQPKATVQKKSWLQLFARSSAVSPCPDTDTTSFANQNSRLEAGSVQSTDKKAYTNYSFNNQINFGQLLPSTIYPLANDSFSCNAVACSVGGAAFPPLVTEPGQDSIVEDGELFEDPCYIPDPVTLLGPISKSLDNFPLDPGSGFVTNNKMEGPPFLKNASASTDMNKPSPIESPMSRLRGSKEKHNVSGQAICTPKSQIKHVSNLDGLSNAHEQGTWQMWGKPLAQDGLGLTQDGLGLTGGPYSWFSPVGLNKSIQEDFVLPLSHNRMMSQLAKENHVLPAIGSPQSARVCNHESGGPFNSLGNHENGGAFNSLGHCLNDSDLCIQNTPFQPFPVEGESHFLPHNLIDDINQNEARYKRPDASAIGHAFQLPPDNCWCLGDSVMHGSEDAGNSSRPHVGGSLFPTNPDVQSLWSSD